MKHFLLRILAVLVLLGGMSSCGTGDHYLKRHKFYKKTWHRRWARPGRHYGTGYF